MNYMLYYSIWYGTCRIFCIYAMFCDPQAHIYVGIHLFFVTLCCRDTAMCLVYTWDIDYKSTVLWYSQTWYNKIVQICSYHALCLPLGTQLVPSPFCCIVEETPLASPQIESVTLQVAKSGITNRKTITKKVNP